MNGKKSRIRRKSKRCAFASARSTRVEDMYRTPTCQNGRENGQAYTIHLLALSMTIRMEASLDFYKSRIKSNRARGEHTTSTVHRCTFQPFHLYSLSLRFPCNTHWVSVLFHPFPHTILLVLFSSLFLHPLLLPYTSRTYLFVFVSFIHFIYLRCNGIVYYTKHIYVYTDIYPSSWCVTRMALSRIFPIFYSPQFFVFFILVKCFVSLLLFFISHFHRRTDTKSQCDNVVIRWDCCASASIYAFVRVWR